MPSIQVTKEVLDQLVAKGLVEAPAKRGKRAKDQLLPPSFIPGESPVWVVPVKTVSEANSRGWRQKSGRTQGTRKAVCRALGQHLEAVIPFATAFHAGRAVVVRLTRLGGQKLDRTANLPSSLKAVEDSVALVMGADDGAPNWRCEVDQEPGGDWGVRIQLELM